MKVAEVDKIGQKINNQKQRLSGLTGQQRAISKKILSIEKSLPQLAKDYADELRAFSFQYMRERYPLCVFHVPCSLRL